MRQGLASSPPALAAWILSGLLLAFGAKAFAETGNAHCPLPARESVSLAEAVVKEGCPAEIPRHLENGGKAAGLLFGIPLDLNRASAAALEVLPGIGPRRAMAVQAARDESRFRRVSDLERVPGIGPRTLERVRPFVRVGQQPSRSRAGGEAL